MGNFSQEPRTATPLQNSMRAAADLKGKTAAGLRGSLQESLEFAAETPQDPTLGGVNDGHADPQFLGHFRGRSALDYVLQQARQVVGSNSVCIRRRALPTR